MAPPFQPNGESSAELGRKYIEECMTSGSARFDWMACAPNGEEIPLEVTLTRIEWSGRQVIQAFITDITERKRAQAALAESEARFSAAFEASPILIVIARMSDQKYVLVNDAFVNWSGFAREEILGRELDRVRHLGIPGRARRGLGGFATPTVPSANGNAGSEIGGATEPRC